MQAMGKMEKNQPNLIHDGPKKNKKESDRVPLLSIK